MLEGNAADMFPRQQLASAAYGRTKQERTNLIAKKLVPDSLHYRLFGRGKVVAAIVTVKPCGNAFRIVKVDA